MAVKLLDEALAKIDLLLARFSLPDVPVVSTQAAPTAAAPAKAPAAPALAAAESKPAAPTPASSSAAPAACPTTSTAQTPIPDLAAAQAVFDKVLIKVARVISVEDVENSEKLFKLQVDLGGGETRQVCAGLRQFLSADELRDRMVCVVANLKPAKLAGQASEAMILAAEAPLPGATGGVLVRTLLPPVDANPGDQVFLSGGRPSVAFVKVLKSDDFKKIAAQLLVLGGCACYAGHQLATNAGSITLAADVPNGSSIH